MDRADLYDRLARLDEDASLEFDDTDRFRMIIVGGSALILLECISRATLDVDVISVSPQIYSLLARYDINCRVQTYINNFPYNFEDRIVHIPVGGKKISFYTASIEDIVVAKLYSPRDQDKVDIQSPDVLRNIDWDLLEKLAVDEGEALASALNQRNYNDFKTSYDEYKRRFRP